MSIEARTPKDPLDADQVYILTADDDGSGAKAIIGVSQDNTAAGTEYLGARIGSDGFVTAANALQVAKYPPGAATINGAVVGGTTSVVTFDSAVLPGSLALGAVVKAADGSSDSVSVKSVSVDAYYRIVGFTAAAPWPQSHSSHCPVYWDSIDNASAVWRIARGYKAGSPADSTTGPFLQVGNITEMADGSIWIGSYPLCDSQGRVLSVAPGALRGGESIHGLERVGGVLFDASFINSTTSEIQTSINGSHTVYNPAYSALTGFSGGAPTAGVPGSAPGSGQPASWYGSPLVDISTNVLQLTAAGGDGSPGAAHGSHVRYSDALPAKITIDRDTSIAIPVYLGASGSAQLGSIATLSGPVSSGSAVVVPIKEVASTRYTVASDLWVINPGGSNSETAMVSSFSSTNKTITFSSLANTHAAGETMVLWKATGGTVKVSPPPPIGESYGLSDVPADIGAIAFGFEDASSVWHRGWWGDPTWVTPYSGSYIWLGGIPLVPSGGNAWRTLHVSASRLGIDRTTPISRVELFAYAASGTKTVYFEAVQAGRTGHPSRIPANSIRGNHLKQDFPYPATGFVLNATTAFAGVNYEPSYSYEQAPSAMTPAQAKAITPGGWEIRVKDNGQSDSDYGAWTQAQMWLPNSIDSTSIGFIPWAQNVGGGGGPTVGVCLNSVILPDITTGVWDFVYQVIGQDNSVRTPKMQLRWAGLSTS